MKSRSNQNHLLHSRYFTVQNRNHQEPRCPDRSSRPSSHPSNTLPATHQDTPTEEPDTELILEHEISLSELNDFALACIEQLSLTKKDRPAEEIITTAISEKLPSYTTLKAEFLTSRRTHQNHHVWTKQMYGAVEPLIKNDTGPAVEQQKLSQLTVECVEQNLQLQYRVDQLRRRLDFLENAVSRHLVNIGREIGLPSALMNKLGKLTKSIMERYA